MRGLTLWQPMGWAIAHRHKPVENRPWPLPPAMVGERFAVHAGKHYEEPMAQVIRERFGLEVPSRDEIALGAVIAVATFRGSVDNDSLHRLRAEDLPRIGMPISAFQAIHDWFSGPHGFLLSDVLMLEEPVVCRGMQGLWRLDENLEAQVNERIVHRDATDDELDAIATKSMTDLVHETASLAIHAERKRCLTIIRDRAQRWRSNSSGASSLVASALDHVAKEIEGT